MLLLTRRLVAFKPLSLRALSTSEADVEKAIINKLTERLSPTELTVQDVSGGCGTFFAIRIASDAFKGLPTIRQHKLVTETLKQEIGGIHGLQIKTILPSS